MTKKEQLKKLAKKYCEELDEPKLLTALLEMLDNPRDRNWQFDEFIKWCENKIII